MPAPYSQDLRDRVIAASHRGMRTKQIADLFSVSSSWVRRVKQRLREHGEVAPRASEPKCRFMKIDRSQLAQLVEAHPDATLSELRVMLAVPCAPSTIWKALDAMGYTFKKRRSMLRNKTGRTSRNVDRYGRRSNPGSMHPG